MSAQKSLIIILIVAAVITAFLLLKPVSRAPGVGANPMTDRDASPNASASPAPEQAQKNGNPNSVGGSKVSDGGANSSDSQNGITGGPKDIPKSDTEIEGGSLPGSKVRKTYAPYFPDKSDFEADPKNSKMKKKTADAPVDPNQVDIDWVSQIPDPNITVNKAFTSVERYHSALKTYQAGDLKRSLHLVFSMGERAAQDVTYSVSHMNKDEYASVEPRLEGFIFDRKGIFEIYPDYKFFSDLANRYGKAAEAAYFQLANELLVNGISKYYKRITEFSTCTIYGQNLVVDAFAKWTDYQNRYPNDFANEVVKKIDEATGELTTNDCLCGSEKTLYQEYSKFFKAFPKDELVKDLQERTAAVQSGKLKLRADCKATNPDDKVD